METFLKLAIVVGVIYLLFRWWAYGAHANVNIGPGYGQPGWNVPQAGYTFTGPGVMFGLNPNAWGSNPGYSQY